jgi:hypothetical protein
MKKIVEKKTLISLIHVAQPTLENGGAWVLWKEHLVNVTYQVKYPFAQFACCTCKWALQRNLCKHQIMVILTCTNNTQENIIEYCGTQYGYEHGRLATMFVNL